MSEATHTPGPWRAYKDRVYAKCRSGRDEVIAQADSPYVQDAKANARLIAAAPDMLAALELLLAAKGSKTLYMDAHWLAANAAVAAAKGGA